VYRLAIFSLVSITVLAFSIPSIFTSVTAQNGTGGKIAFMYGGDGNSSTGIYTAKFRTSIG
jgi:hypothetical protein